MRRYPVLYKLLFINRVCRIISTPFTSETLSCVYYCVPDSLRLNEFRVGTMSDWVHFLNLQIIRETSLHAFRATYHRVLESQSWILISVDMHCPEKSKSRDSGTGITSRQVMILRSEHRENVPKYNFPKCTIARRNYYSENSTYKYIKSTRLNTPLLYSIEYTEKTNI